MSLRTRACSFLRVRRFLPSYKTAHTSQTKLRNSLVLSEYHLSEVEQITAQPYGQTHAQIHAQIHTRQPSWPPNETTRPGTRLVYKPSPRVNKQCEYKPLYPHSIGRRLSLLYHACSFYLAGHGYIYICSTSPLLTRLPSCMIASQ